MCWSPWPAAATLQAAQTQVRRHSLPCLQCTLRWALARLPVCGAVRCPPVVPRPHQQHIQAAGNFANARHVATSGCVPIEQILLENQECMDRALKPDSRRRAAHPTRQTLPIPPISLPALLHPPTPPPPALLHSLQTWQ